MLLCLPGCPLVSCTMTRSVTLLALQACTREFISWFPLFMRWAPGKTNFTSCHSKINSSYISDTRNMSLQDGIPEINGTDLGKHFQPWARVSWRSDHDLGILHSSPLILVIHVGADTWTDPSWLILCIITQHARHEAVHSIHLRKKYVTNPQPLHHHILVTSVAAQPLCGPQLEWDGCLCKMKKHFSWSIHKQENTVCQQKIYRYNNFIIDYKMSGPSHIGKLFDLLSRL